MSNKFSDKALRRDVRDRFSVTALQDEIDERFNDPVFDTYSVKELQRLRRLASKALRLTNNEDVYGSEVFITSGEDDFVYHVDSEGTQLRVSYDEPTTLYGYVRDFKVLTLPDYDNKQALVARIEELFDDTEETQSYHIPLAIEGISHASSIHDAPVPVMESDTDMTFGAIYPEDSNERKSERDEQGVQLSLLNIIEQDLFDSEDGVSDTRQLSEEVGRMLDAGFIEDVDDFATAFNYYLAKRAHDNDAVFLDVRGGEMTELDGPLGEVTEGRWVEEKLELASVDFQVDENMLVSMSVYCFHVTDEGVAVYCSDEAETEGWEFTVIDLDEDE